MVHVSTRASGAPRYQHNTSEPPTNSFQSSINVVIHGHLNVVWSCIDLSDPLHAAISTQRPVTVTRWAARAHSSPCTVSLQLGSSHVHCQRSTTKCLALKGHPHLRHSWVHHARCLRPDFHRCSSASTRHWTVAVATCWHHEQPDPTRRTPVHSVRL